MYSTNHDIKIISFFCISLENIDVSTWLYMLIHVFVQIRHGDVSATLISFLLILNSLTARNAFLFGMVQYTLSPKNDVLVDMQSL